MFRDASPTSAASSGTDPRTRRHDRSEGYVVECDGTRAVICAHMTADDSVSADYWAVGTLISINTVDARTVGMLYQVDAPSHQWSMDEPNRIEIHVELIGEITDDASGRPVFISGLSSYPHLGAKAHRIRSTDLQAIFANTDASAAAIGALSQNHDIPAMLSIDEIVSRHFSVVGTTGVGKSAAVSLLVRKIAKLRPDLGILVLDPHDEFAAAFPDLAETINETTLDLPFWLFRLEEFVEVLFRGRRADPQEVDILRDLIPVAKQRFKGEAPTIAKKTTRSDASLTADTPVPYRVSDLLALIDERTGQLDQRDARIHLKALAARINAAINDPRYRFMFANKTISDNLVDVLGHIYRVPANGRPVTIFQLNGIPSEVVNAVVSVLCRLAFDLAVWSQAKVRTLVLCEEAHRYIPADREAGFGPTRAAIARIAKEGRKYGVSLGIITQRPSELDATILSQCSTTFAMRLGNDIDQDIMRKAISGASRSYINFLPSLANREAISFGQGVSTPIRMFFETLPDNELPANHLAADEEHDDKPADLATIVQTMRDPAANALGHHHEPVDETAMVSEQRPSIDPAGTPGIQGPASHDEELFSYDGPLRRKTDQPVGESLRAGRRHDDPPPRPATAPRNTDLINRFRK